MATESGPAGVQWKEDKGRVGEGRDSSGENGEKMPPSGHLHEADLGELEAECE